MKESRIRLKIADILAADALGKGEKITRLTELRREARDEQRAASEAGMIDDDGLNADLREIDLALDQLGANVTSIEDKGAATL
ncbi:hypothetical protein FQ775_18730 [Nitratireductor mangrovi]|uniref:Uncharacterized protein n=1 Tax=Nitratireductor mangrovi TaxID=2599600 RepID=A0A5B8L334_9HYPH|nr:hypothetical protein FQ775_18730 [Nitratireductor mangrovi]